jgi:hypothetical protein
MFCPKCRVRCREEVTQCPDCGTSLAAAADGSEPHSGLVSVFESNDTFAIAFAKGILDEAGIPYWVQGDETGARLVLSPVIYPECRFLVPQTHATEARQLLEQLTRPNDDMVDPATT